MTFESGKSTAERAVELVAALSLGVALAVAIWLLLPVAPGARALAAVLVGTVTAGLGLGVVRASGSQGYPSLSFEPAPFVVDDDELLLDDPVVPLPAAESRVVQLFVRDPGDMDARINGLLDQGQGTSRRSGAVRPDASAALHAALAEIRHSLR